MEQVFLKAPAKINLTLDVVSKRSDGYHNISSVMQTVSLFDDIRIRKTNLPGVKLFTNVLWLPNDRKNLVYKIAEDLLNEYNIDFGVTIKIFKRIPIGAGLAGGSSDCAATLKGMMELFKLPISTYQAYKICEKYGADVPFCFMGGTVLTKGIGNILHRISEHPQTYIVLVKPSFFVSTEKIYKMINQEDMNLVRAQEILSAIKCGHRKDIASNLFNALERPATFLHPVILKIKEELLNSGALGSCMSGSGPTVFGYYKDYASARKSAYVIEKKIPSAKIYVVRTIN